MTAGARLRNLRLFMMGVAVLLVVRVGFSTVGYLWISRNLPTGSKDRAPKAFLHRVGHAVVAAAAWIPGCTCLVQAVSAQILLSARGYASEIHIGVKPSDGRPIDAHAWLVSDGQVVVGDALGDLSSYAPLAVFESRR